eukprot:5723877-Pleurochrysis_carterae.AAC.7
MVKKRPLCPDQTCKVARASQEYIRVTNWQNVADFFVLGVASWFNCLLEVVFMAQLFTCVENKGNMAMMSPSGKFLPWNDWWSFKPCKHRCWDAVQT